MAIKTSNTVAFILGVAVGSAITWHLLKTKYEQIAQDEINSVKTMFVRREDITTVEKEEEDTPMDNIPEEEMSIQEYAAKLQKSGYINYADISAKTEAKEDSDSGAYVIPPDEFGEIEDYAQISLNYFADGVLTDDNYEVVEDVDYTVGIDSLDHFGEYEADSVFVRNDKLRCDYEILKDHRTYGEALQTIPHPMEEQ